MKRKSTRSLFISLLLFSGFFNSIAQPGVDGARTITTNGAVVNAYTPLLSTVTACTNSIPANIASLNNGTALTTGSLIMIIAMQGATIDTANSASYGQIIGYNGAGKYEFATVSAVSGVSTITLQSPLSNSYTVGGTNRVQVVRVPQYTTFSVNAGASVTGSPWNGSSGGVVAVAATGVVTVNGSIVADTMGFRGGVAQGTTTMYGITGFKGAATGTGGEKGESIVGFEADYDALGGRYCRGAAANGGGGGDGENAPGGGGANGNNGVSWNGMGNPDLSGGVNWIAAWDLESANFANNVSSGGGRGGYSWALSPNNPSTTAPGNTAWGGDDHRNVGGWGGMPLAINAENTIFFGGGGGAGHMDSHNGTSGGRGGGIVYIVATSVTGTGLISANGQKADTAGLNALYFDDGPGGGGGGGTVIIKSAVASSLTLHADGGQGGSQVSSNILALDESEGGGGGGGGGYIAITSGTPTMTVNGGANGTISSLGNTGFPPSGGTMGATGQTATVSITFMAHDSVGLVSTPTTICQGDTAVIIASGGVSYSWSTGSASSGIMVTPGNTASYVVTATFTGGCTATATTTVTVNSGPIATIVPGGATSFCQGDSVTLTAGTGATYSWNPTGGGATSQSIIANQSGTYTVTVTNGNNCSATASQTVTVNAPPAAGISTTATGCGSVSLTATGGTGYIWSGGSSPNTATNTFTSNGTYIVSVTNSNNCSATASQMVTVSSTLTAGITGTPAGCGSVSLTATGGTNYAWSGGTTPNTAANTFTSGGNYVVTVTGTGNCSATAGVTVNVSAGITLSTVSTNATCGNNNGSASVSITAGAGPYTYVWSNSQSSDTITNVASGSYTVTVTGAGNCSASATASISNTGGINLTTSSSNTSCGNNNGMAIATPTTGTAPYTYLWSNTANSDTISGLSAGTYTLTVQDASHCSATASASILPSVADSSITLQASKTIMCPGDSAQICAPAGYTSYAWSNAHTTACFETTLPGNYAVTVTDNRGCTASSNHANLAVYTVQPVAMSVSNDTLSVIGDYSFQWYYDNTMVPGDTSSVLIATLNGQYYVVLTDTNGCIQASTVQNVTNITGVEQLSADGGIKLFPNPNTGNFTVMFRDDAPGEIEITDALGRIVAASIKLEKQKNFNLEELAAGIYFMRISQNGDVRCLKFSITR